LIGFRFGESADRSHSPIHGGYQSRIMDDTSQHVLSGRFDVEQKASAILTVSNSSPKKPRQWMLASDHAVKREAIQVASCREALKMFDGR
jgi:hypothetical protein